VLDSTSHLIYSHGIGPRHRDNFIFTLVGVLTVAKTCSFKNPR
jgi:hypothetical protein